MNSVDRARSAMLRLQKQETELTNALNTAKNLKGENSKLVKELRAALDTISDLKTELKDIKKELNKLETKRKKEPKVKSNADS